MKQFVWLVFFLVSCMSCEIGSGDRGDDESAGDLKVVKLTPEVYIDKISDQLVETSGLIWFDSKLWSLNDGGGKNEIYAIDSDGEVVLTVEMDETTNHDWEAITQDDNYIYVGDFGNNKGNRTDLRVYKIRKENLITNEQFLNVSAEKIEFSYHEQTDFSEREYQHEFDCAAMFSYQDYLYLFSKDWKNFKTRVYKLSKTPAEYELNAVDSFDVNGLITGADLSSDGKYFALVGYGLGWSEFVVPFIYLFEFNSSELFSPKSVYFDLSSIGGAQTEGICFLNNKQIVISTEATDSYVQKAFLIDLSEHLSHFD